MLRCQPQTKMQPMISHWMQRSSHFLTRWTKILRKNKIRPSHPRVNNEPFFCEAEHLLNFCLEASFFLKNLTVRGFDPPEVLIDGMFLAFVEQEVEVEMEPETGTGPGNRQDHGTI